MAERPKILIIDDEEVILDSCASILRAEKYEVAAAPDGTRGLEQAREFRPDVTVVDLKMPGLSGHDVIERLRALDPDAVVVVITGYATVSSAVESMRRGAYDFLPKPFTPDEFRLILRRALEKRRLVLETAALRREREILRKHYAAIVSHELKSPLAAMQQMLFALVEELAPRITEEQKERLERMKVRIGDLLQIIHRWLRMLSVDMSRIRETFRTVSPSEIVAKAVESVQPLAVRKSIELTTSVDGTVGTVNGDEGTLIEALINVVGNAVEYSPPGSRVTIRTRSEGDQVLIAVTDTGAGIADVDLPRIFDDFYRGGAGAEGEGGCGLGLPLSRRLVRAHGGDISVTSRPGQGSTFVIRLPSQGADASSRAPAGE
jgi:two-component system sensor histidine kinase/response regulator